MLAKKHLQEWIDSVVDPKLTSLNILSLSDFEPYEYLLYGLPDNERRNDGRVRDWVLRRYAHCELGGWWCAGIDILSDDKSPSQWGTFKPERPKQKIEYNRQGHFRKATLIKYEHPPKTETEIFALAIPLHLWKAIALRYNIPLPEKIVITPQGRALGFWAWVIENPQIPLIITEGAKKAGTIITAEYVAIALPGIYNGYRQPKDEYGHQIDQPYLIPHLQALAQKDREIIFCFDRDRQPQTIQNVRKALAKTGGLFEREGCQVSVITWKFPEKGVDDLIAARGADCFHQLYKTRISLSAFQLNILLDLAKYKLLTVNQRYLSDQLVPPPEAQVIGLRSPKDTGKTQWLTGIVEKARTEGRRALVITHRIQLAQTLCERFSIDHIEDLYTSQTQGALGYGLCIDSLHPDSKAKFNPDDWAGAVVILDEVEQVLWHMLESNTCKDYRVKIIDNFKQLLNVVVNTGGQIYLADADLSVIAVDYILELTQQVETCWGNPSVSRPQTNQPWLVENIYQPEQRQLITYSGHDPIELVANLVKSINCGERALVHTTGQKAKSKWGTINLESYLQQQFPQKRILRIDRESVADPNHPAYGCMSHLDFVLGQYDIVICSPVIETGVSIELKGHFARVYAIAWGLQSVDTVCQTLARLRDTVPRHIWVKKTAKQNRVGNGSVNFLGLIDSQNKLTQANINLLHQAGVTEVDDFHVNFSQASLNAWGKRACVVNAGKNNYRDEVVSKLVSEGYEVHQPDEEDTAAVNQVKEDLQQVRQENYQQYCTAVPRAVTPSESELKKLQDKKRKTEPERLIQRKGELIKKYGVEVTPELVEKDDRGWYGQLQLHYYLTIGKVYLAARDQRAVMKMKEYGNQSAFAPDVAKQLLSAQIKALELIQLEQFLDQSAEFTKHNLADWFELLVKLRFELKTILGVTINPETDSGIVAAQRILNKLGLKLKCDRQVRIDGQPVRFYKICNPNWDGRDQVLAYWLKRDESQTSVTANRIRDLHTPAVA